MKNTHNTQCAGKSETKIIDKVKNEKKQLAATHIVNNLGNVTLINVCNTQNISSKHHSFQNEQFLVISRLALTAHSPND